MTETKIIAATDFPVDAVFTWVRNDDAHRQVLQQHRQDATLVPKCDSGAERFDDHDELLFALRSVRANAPFVRHIFIVVADYQAPRFLRAGGKQTTGITIIRHSDLFPDKTHLPTFNSQAIESHLHRIPDLAEHFIYLNDDMGFSGPVTRNTFFTPTGHFNVHVEHVPVSAQKPGGNAAGYRHSRYNSAMLVKKATGAWPNHLHHQAKGMRRSALEDLWTSDLTQPAMQATSAARFRSRDDVEVFSLASFIAIKTAKAKYNSRLPTQIYVGLRNGLRFADYGRLLRNRTPTLYCVNEIGGGRRLQFEDVFIFRQVMRKLFPKPFDGEWIPGTAEEALADYLVDHLFGGGSFVVSANPGNATAQRLVDRHGWGTTTGGEPAVLSLADKKDEGGDSNGIAPVVVRVAVDPENSAIRIGPTHAWDITFAPEFLVWYNRWKFTHQPTSAKMI